MFKKNTVTTGAIVEISDLLAKIHFEIQKEKIKQEQQPTPKPKHRICSFWYDLFGMEQAKVVDRVRLLEICRDYLRNKPAVDAEQLDHTFEDAPRDIKTIYKQIKTFSDETKEVCRKLFNDQGYITSTSMTRTVKS